MARKKKGPVERFADAIRRWELKWLREAMKHRQKKLELKAEVQKNSNSLLWVWEFSKKAVLICFMFYVAVQVYAMVVMWLTQDFTSLPNLIDRTAELTERCVFAYLIKAGVENIGKIWFSHFKRPDEDQTADSGDEPVG